jgi:hypothetical protein
MSIKEELAYWGGWLIDHGFELDADSGWWLRDATCVVFHWNRVRLLDVIVYRFPSVAALRANKGRPTWVVEMSGETPDEIVQTAIQEAIRSRPLDAKRAAVAS